MSYKHVKNVQTEGVGRSQKTTATFTTSKPPQEVERYLKSFSYSDIRYEMQENSSGTTMWKIWTHSYDGGGFLDRVVGGLKNPHVEDGDGVESMGDLSLDDEF